MIKEINIIKKIYILLINNIMPFLLKNKNLDLIKKISKKNQPNMKIKK